VSEISLRVTKAELDHLAETAGKDQRQIALTSASSDIAAEVASITGKNKRILVIGGCIELVLADRSAVWRAHNADREEDFDALFNLLARRPGQAMRILCQIRMP
jgi:hypothetical protein